MRIIKNLIATMLLIVLISLAMSYVLCGGPHVIVNHVRLHQTPEKVFDYCSDMRNELKWNPDVQHMEKVTAGEPGPGTQFRAKWHLSDTIIVTLEQYERPKHLTFVNGGPAEVTLDVHLTPVLNETELESRFMVTPHGFLRAVFPIFRMQMEKQEKTNMVNLKKAIEHAE